MSVFTVINRLRGKRKLGCWFRPQGPVAEQRKYQPGNRLGVRIGKQQFGASGDMALTDIVSIEDHVPFLYDQGYTGACVAEALRNACHTVESVQGLPLIELSARAPYWLGRAKGGLQDQDAGMYPDDALWCANKYGIATEEAFPWSELRIQQKPGVDVVLSGDPLRKLQYEYITGPAGDRRLLIVEALKEGLPVMASALVGRGFMSCKGDVVFNEYELEPSGGHMFFFVGAALDGRTPLLRLCNSWGKEWGDEGFLWVGPKFFSECRDLVVIHGWKRSAAQREQLITHP